MMSDSLHIVEPTTCRGDGICVEVCPENVLAVVDGVASTVPERADACILCGQCVAVCPNEAISMQELPPDRFRDLAERTASYEDLHALMESRRSVRVFKDIPVEDETIDRLLHAASTAPMGLPPHSTGVVVITDREERELLLEKVVKEYTQIGKAMKSPAGRAMIRVFAGGENYRMLKNYIVDLSSYANTLYRHDGTDRYMYRAPAFFLFHADTRALAYEENAHIVCSCVMLAAQSLGLGSTVIGLVPPIVDQSKLLRARYGIPGGNRVVTSLAVGYPKYRYRKSILRDLAGVRRL
jgi:ferredoxin